jgi:[acyl-carrier-protein] S-malonyltransferase
MRLVILFPGQGSQSEKLFDTQGLWDSWAQDWAALEESVPNDYHSIIACINHTTIAQPAIVGYSYTAFQKISPLLKQHEIVALAGHSLGELTAASLCLGWSKKTAMQIAVQRALLMQQACDNHKAPLSMQAWIGRSLRKERIEDFLQSRESLWLINDNSRQQVVVAGVLTHLTEEQRDDYGIDKIVALPVSVISHCPVLESVLPAWHDVLKSTISTDSTINYPLISHTSLEFLRSPSMVVESLTQQLTSRVRFHEMIQMLAPQTDMFIDIGPSQVLKNLIIKSGLKGLTLAEFLQQQSGVFEQENSI